MQMDTNPQIDYIIIQISCESNANAANEIKV